MISFAFVEFPNWLSLDGSALGESFKGAIGRHPVTFFSPALRAAESNTNAYDRFWDLHRTLGPPVELSNFLSKPDERFWGRIREGNPKTGRLAADVKYFLATFDLPDLDLEAAIAEVHSMNTEWLDRLYSFLRLQTGQNNHNVTRVSGSYGSRLELYRAKPSIEFLQEKNKTINIAINIHAPSTAATKADIEKTIEMCSLGNVIPLHYELLLRAFDAHQAHDPRNTVIEASTALEVAVTKRIRTELETAGIPPDHIELMLEGHSMLRKRVDLLKKLGITGPITRSQFEEEILKIRNRVIHGGYPVSDRESSKLVKNVELFVRSITPDFAVPP